eukprot:scaffold221451_cov24-Tisochrysis_lutea.AAC.1
MYTPSDTSGISQYQPLQCVGGRKKWVKWMQGMRAGRDASGSNWEQQGCKKQCVVSRCGGWEE